MGADGSRSQVIAMFVAACGARRVVTTGAAGGKVRRLRHEPRETLRPCDRRGRVAADAAEHELRGEVVTDPARRESAIALLARTYGVE